MQEAHVAAPPAQLVTHHGGELLRLRDHRLGHEGIVGGVDHQGGDGDLRQHPQARAALVVVIGAVKTVQRRRDLLVEVAQGGDGVHLLRLPAGAGRRLPPDLLLQVVAHGAQQITLIDPREALIDPIGAAVQPQRRRDHHRRLQLARAGARQQIDQHVAPQRIADGDERLAGKAAAELGDHRLGILDGTGVIGLQQPVRLAAAAAKVHQYRLVALALQVGEQPLGIVGVNASLQPVKQHDERSLIPADLAAPGEIDEVAVRQLEALSHEAGRLAAQPLGQDGLQVGIARPPGGVKVALDQHAGSAGWQGQKRKRRAAGLPAVGIRPAGCRGARHRAAWPGSARWLQTWSAPRGHPPGGPAPR